MAQLPGMLIISLDFELYWGVWDHLSLDEYGDNLLGARQAVPALLDLFGRYGIHATWATVGFLFFANRDQLLAALPAIQPDYEDSALDVRQELLRLGHDEHTDPYHYGASLIQMIREQPDQEMGSQTFSHYYCQEPGQTIEAFRADIDAAVTVARNAGLTLSSLVFPRNQYSDTHLEECATAGFRCYRGNPAHPIYAGTAEAGQTLGRRALRFIDSYISLTGHNCTHPTETQGDAVVNVRSSRFLRPYSPRLRMLEPLRLRRIVKSLRYAAERGLIYHLWWHPHNFGIHLASNLAFLEEILREFKLLQERHSTMSANMGEATELLLSTSSRRGSR